MNRKELKETIRIYQQMVESMIRFARHAESANEHNSWFKQRQKTEKEVKEMEDWILKHPGDENENVMQLAKFEERRDSARIWRIGTRDL